jgi:putative ABC transport system permease protein
VHLQEGVRVALSSLWAYKLRTFLTVLGNVVAVTSVIAVVSLIDGMDLFVRREIADEGSTVLTLRRMDDLQALTNLEAFLEALHNPRITLDDFQALRDADLQYVEYLAAYRSSRGRVSHGGRSAKEASIRGWTADYPHLLDLELSDGRHFNAFESRASRPVAIIGSDIAERILRTREPLGKMLRVNGRHVEVIGVLKEEGGIMGQNPNLVVYMPLGRFFKIYGSRQSLAIRLKVPDVRLIPDAREEVRMHMRIRHAREPGQGDDFAITSADRILDLWKGISRAIFSALIMLVSISLVVGGVVIMNIMLVSVTERTREVGTRKALGARRADILWQFLVEAMTLSLVGGVLGILLGFGLASLVAVVSPLPYAIEPWSIAAGLLVTLLVGLFFGIYPADRAAKLDPVEALSHE